MADLEKAVRESLEESQAHAIKNARAIRDAWLDRSSKLELNKKVSFGEFDNRATEYIGELVQELLSEKGINPASYTFSIEVEYAEVEDE